jgi:hypothetical protein
MAEQNPDELDPAIARLIGRCWGDVLARLTDSGYEPAGRDRGDADREFKGAILRYVGHWRPVGENKQELS